MNCIKEINDNEVKIIYVRYERGSFEDYAKFYDINIKTKKKYDKEYKYFIEEFYMEKDWIKVEIYKYKEYKTMRINNKTIICSVPVEERKGFEYDISDFLKDLHKRIKYSINLIKNKTYYEILCKEISYRQRVGIIKLDDIFKLNDGWKKDYFEFLTQDDVNLFLNTIDKQLKYTKLVENEAQKYNDDYKKYIETTKQKYKCIGRINTMTAQNYYDICKLCYKSINLEGVKELTSKELFYKYADGRDCGLKDIDSNNNLEFAKWVEKANDHACQIRMGSSTSRIDLWVRKDEKGYYLTLSGKYLWISNEVIKFYVELIKHNIPVYLYDAEMIRNRLIGKGLVGIVPYNVFPRYCESFFEEDICDFINLPDYPKDFNKYLQYIKWQDIENTILKEA